MLPRVGQSRKPPNMGSLYGQQAPAFELIGGVMGNFGFLVWKFKMNIDSGTDLEARIIGEEFF